MSRTFYAIFFGLNKTQNSLKFFYAHHMSMLDPLMRVNLGNSLQNCAVVEKNNYFSHKKKKS